MKREELNTKVGEELEHIPRGQLTQNLFRAAYNMIRRHDLCVNPATPASESFNRALEEVRQNDASFSPVYDTDFFNDKS